MADEKAFLVVVGVDEPGGDVAHIVRADVAGIGVVDVDAVDRDPQLARIERLDVDVGLAEDDKEVALAGIL